MAIDETLPVPPLSVGTPPETAARVVQKQAGTRSQPIAAPLKSVLEFAAKTANVEVVVFSGGQPGKGEGGARTGSTRHDHGNAADVRLYQSGRLLSFTNADDRKIISAFASASAAAGATGIGAGLGYMGPSGIHVGFGPNGAQGGPIMTWGAGGSSANAPEWLTSAVTPDAQRNTIATLQTNLKAMGYLDGEIDGVFGNKTLDAVNAFAAGGQPVQYSMMPGGYEAFLGPGVRQPLPILAPENPAAAPTAIAAVAEAVSGGGRLRKGSSGEPVRQLQSFLNARGVTDANGRALTEDGKFGVRTKQALKAYQEQHPELRRDGVLGPRTLAAIASDQTSANLARGRAAESARLTAQAAAYPKGTTAAESAAETAVTTEADVAAAGQVPVETSMATNGLIGAARGAAVGLALAGFTPDFSIADPYVAGSNVPAALSPDNMFLRLMSPAGAAQAVEADRQRVLGLTMKDINLQRALNDKAGRFREAALDPHNLWADNAFAAHDAVTDPLRLGGGGDLGRTGTMSAPELDTVHSAIKSAASTLRNPQQSAGFGVGSGTARAFEVAFEPDTADFSGARDLSMPQRAVVNPQSGTPRSVNPQQSSGVGGSTPASGFGSGVNPQSGSGASANPQSGSGASANPQSPSTNPQTSGGQSTNPGGAGNPGVSPSVSRSTGVPTTGYGSWFSY